MLNRTAAVCLFCGVVVGYALAGASVRAQNVPPAAPVTVFGGDEVQLQLERGTLQNDSAPSIRCRVVAVEGSWLKCGSADGLGIDRTQKWMNLQYVVQLTKYEK